MDELALLGPPDHFLVEQCAAAFAQRLDDPSPLVEIVPERPRVDELHLLFAVAEQLAQPRVVKEQPPVLVDHDKARRAMLEDLAKLPLVLRDFGLVSGERRTFDGRWGECFRQRASQWRAPLSPLEITSRM